MKDTKEMIEDILNLSFELCILSAQSTAHNKVNHEILTTLSHNFFDLVDIVRMHAVFGENDIITKNGVTLESLEEKISNLLEAENAH